MTPAEAANKVKQSEGYKCVTKVVDFDPRHYVVEAFPKEGEFVRGYQTTFGVDKSTGQVTAFMLNDGNNLDKFVNAKNLLS